MAVLSNRNVLFFSRLGLYLLLICTPLFLSPVVVVAYDSYGWFIWFFLVPVEMGLAYFLRPPRFSWWVSWLAALGIVLLGLFFFSAFVWEVMALIFSVAFIAYGSTRLIFRSALGPGIAVLEVFLFALVYFRLLDFTRSAPEIAEKFPLFAKVLLVLLIFSFLLHGIIVYSAAFPDRSFGKRRRELVSFVAIVLPLLVLFAFVSPLDFVEHQVIFNELQEDPPPTAEELEQQEGDSVAGDLQLDNNRNGLPLGDREEKYPSQLQGGGQSGGDGDLQDRDERDEKEQRGQQEEEQREEGPGRGRGRQQEGRSSEGGEDRAQRLEGIPADQWKNFQENGEGDNKQRAVMVVASGTNPIYAADSYMGRFSKEEGFTLTPIESEPLNKLGGLHLIETWKDRVTSRDDKRDIVPIFILSTLERRVVPYRPFQVQPTVQDVIYHPFDLSYHAQSRVSFSQPEDWRLVRNLNAVERERMASYLELPLSSAEKGPFLEHLNRLYASHKKAFEKEGEKAATDEGTIDRETIDEGTMDRGTIKEEQTTKESQESSNGYLPQRYFDRLDLILKGFKNHQYELGFNDNMTFAYLRRFLVDTKSGDCTEFAHSAALLGRLAGLPSRVVVGFLASKDLQTPVHRGGLYHLRKAIKLLQNYSLDELYLVTTAHRHAWVQYWLPGYGWIDFEATAYAIPPKPHLNPNNMDLVIPMIEEERAPLPRPFIFPWRLALELIAMTALAIVVTLYLYRTIRQLFLRLTSRGNSPRSLQSLLLLALIRLASDGYPLKPRYQTILEYAGENRELKLFKEAAQLFTVLQFKERYLPGEKEEEWRRLKSACRTALAQLRRPGFLRLLRRFSSLRSLYY